MAMFVRSPHKNQGAETDRAPIELGSDLDKQAIKAMIERKRQNDLIRRREFAQLRRVRNKDTSHIKGAAAAPSFFQSSFVSSDLMGREDTLKKIDEIEAQMSKQWWKGKNEEKISPTVPMERSPPASTKKFDLPNVAGHLQRQQHPSGLHFAPTVKSNEFGESDGAHAPSHSHSHSHANSHSIDAAHTKDDTDFLSTLKEFTPSSESDQPNLKQALGEPMFMDAVLEEAAMRFANADDRGVEVGLLAALRQPRILERTAKHWIPALLDLYRATHNQVGFFGAITEFARYLDGVEPQWEAIGGALQTAKNTRIAGAIWTSPPQLDAVAMEVLRNAMYSNPMPWHLDWCQLQRITEDAMPLLAGLFCSLCDEPVTLSFSGAHVLVDCLRSIQTPGVRKINPDWWVMRLNVLRVTQMMDDFEAAALDYCITYEVSPPAWEKARCTYSNIEDKPPEAPPPILTNAKSSTADASPLWELRGIFLGDSTEVVLASFVQEERIGLPITIHCHHLVRVDFAAAGSILNWAAMRQAEGSLVQFKDVHHLVAVFFHVIGIHEHARIVSRSL